MPLTHRLQTMLSISRAISTALWAITLTTPVLAQRELSGAAETRLALEKLRGTGSILMIAAHPDDETTALLAYFARGRKVRTAYLSLTRGEGGQNLIGSEQGDALGVIRTQELLAARKIDGAEQFFTRAIDFGFSKTPQETLEKWGHDKILGDVVWVIRRVSAGRYHSALLRYAPRRPRPAPGIGDSRQRSVFRGRRSPAFPRATQMGQDLAGETADVERVRLHPRTGERG